MRLQQFGPYLLQQHPLELREGRRAVNLSHRQLQVLAVLVKAGGGTVSKQRLMQSVWPDQVVDEANLTQTVFLLRKSLGQMPDGGEYVETVRSKGYRLAPRSFVDSRLSRREVAASADNRPGQIGVYPFEHLVDSIEDYAIYMLDCTGKIMTWNAGAEKTKGYVKSEILGLHFSLFFVPEDAETRVPERLLAVAARNGRSVGEGWRLRKSGERFWASYVLTRVSDHNGKLIGFAKVVRDLTERKQIEDTLRRMELAVRRERDRLHAAVESSLDAFYICAAVRDQAGEIEDFVLVYLNSNAERLASSPRSKLMGQRMLDVIPVSGEPGWYERCKKVTTTGIPEIAEFSVGCKDESSRWRRVQIVRLEDGVAITASLTPELKG